VAKLRKYSRIVETFDRLAHSYGGPEGLEEVNRIRLAAFARAFRGAVLDVGCGSGTFMEKYFDPSSHFLVSADFSENMIRVARGRMDEKFGPGACFVQSLAQELPFPGETFDACVCVNTLHNMPQWDDVQGAIAEMSRVLRSGGAMLIEFRNMRNPLRRRITQLYDWPHLPQKAFTFEQMKKVLENAGMSVVQRIALYGDRPGKTGIAEPGMSRLLGRRAPRISIVAVKQPPFKKALEDTIS
jgi:ubiquinone/menaquinone biosynthesis C-methylase UbiE